MTAKIFNVILTLAAVIALVGCGKVAARSQNQKGGGKICTMIGVSAIGVNVDVPSGNPNGIKVKISVDNVVKGTYTWTSGTAEFQDNFSYANNKLNWISYDDLPGNYSVTVTQASGASQTKSVTVSIGADGCHVDGKTLNF